MVFFWGGRRGYGGRGYGGRGYGGRGYYDPYYDDRYDRPSYRRGYGGPRHYDPYDRDPYYDDRYSRPYVELPPSREERAAASAGERNSIRELANKIDELNKRLEARLKESGPGS